VTVSVCVCLCVQVSVEIAALLTLKEAIRQQEIRDKMVPCHGMPSRYRYCDRYRHGSGL